jgi:hypothetical protein
MPSFGMRYSDDSPVVPNDCVYVEPALDELQATLAAEVLLRASPCGFVEVQSVSMLASNRSPEALQQLNQEG